MADLTSFNPLKVLLWRDHLEAIARGEFLPPVAVHIDLTNDCNFNCPYCMVRHLRAKRYIPGDHLMRLTNFIRDWGVKAAYVTVSGESMLHPDWTSFIYQLKRNNIEIGVVTNGSLMDEEKRQALVDCCSWVGISLDADNSKTYSKMHGVDETVFQIVVTNIENLVAIKGSLEVTIKYLIHRVNWTEILGATLIAKSLGVDNIHIRPTWDEQVSWPEVKAIRRIVKDARALEDDSFHVHAVRLGILRDKSNSTFSKCWASPLGVIFATDGLVYLCCGLIGQKRAVIGSHYPDPSQVLSFWGSDEHKAVIDAIDPKQCPRCSLTAYQEVIEQVIIEDGMFKKFL